MFSAILLFIDVYNLQGDCLHVLCRYVLMLNSFINQSFGSYILACFFFLILRECAITSITGQEEPMVKCPIDCDGYFSQNEVKSVSIFTVY